MTGIFPVSPSRISDLLLRNRLSSQFEADRNALLDLQNQISTGIRISKPSDDSPSALRGITLQRTIEQKVQIKTNLNVSQSFVSATDSILNSVSDRIIAIRGEALTITDSTTSEPQRAVMIEELQRAIQELVSTGNHQFRGRYLFSGSEDIQPFEFSERGVVYQGNEGSLQSYVDLDLVAPTNVNGNEVFGAISSAVEGQIDLNPVLTNETLLSSLQGGRGISKGSFIVSDGNSSSVVDISNAETIGDVIRLIETNPPDGRTLVARASSSGLVIEIDAAGGGNLAIRDTPEGTTASELGILNEIGVGISALVGDDINPVLRLTTPLGNLLGSRSQVVLESLQPNADILVEAVNNGAEFNDVTVRFVEVSAAGDQAFASYDSVAQELVIDIREGSTTANTVVAAINATGVFSASFDDKRFINNDGTGLVTLASTGTTSGGSGIQFDQTSGLQITNGEETHTVSFENAETVEDLLNTLNQSEAHLLAEINSTGNGIDIRSRLSGSDFQIGENGGTTATELGVRTLTLNTRLSELNFDRGVDVADGTDFVISRKDGIAIEVDISSATTIGDVITAINTHSGNVGNAVVARLAQFGNGIELYDANDAGPETLTVSRAQSFAAWGLGLVESGEDSAAAEAAVSATAELIFATSTPPDAGIQLTSVQPGPEFNDVEIVFQDTRVGDVSDASFDAVAGQLVVNIDSTQTTVNTVLAAINGEGTFSASIGVSSDIIPDGTAIVGTTGTIGTTAGGTNERLISADTNPRETKGVFNSLLRLSDAVDAFDLSEIERAVSMLDDDLHRLSFTRAEVGARGQSLTAIERRVEDEEIELRAALSEEIDTDLVAAISDITARQAGMEATLQLVGRVLRLTLLDFL